MCAAAPRPFAEALPPYSLLIELASDLLPAQFDLRALLHAELEAAFERGEVVDAALDKDEALWGLRHAVSEGLRERGAVIGFDISLPRRAVWAFREARHVMAGGRVPAGPSLRFRPPGRRGASTSTWCGPTRPSP